MVHPVRADQRVLPRDPPRMLPTHGSSRWDLLQVAAAEDEAGVLAAEAEGVFGDDVEVGWTGAAVDDVEADLWVGRAVVARRRDALVGQGADRHDRLDGAGRAHAVSDGALDGGDGDLGGALAEDGVDR